MVTFKKVTTKWRFAPGVGGVSPPLKEPQSGSGRAGYPVVTTKKGAEHHRKPGIPTN